MTILELIQSDGFLSKKKASTRGGEFCGPCPWCGGDDRFQCWPEQGEFGKYWCRSCGKSGDAIQYLRDYRHMTFPEACAYLGKAINHQTSTLVGRTANKPQWEPRVTKAPVELWQKKAWSLVEKSEACLFQSFPFGRKMLGWLKECRGLSEETIKKFRLGLVHIDTWEGHEQWGLDPVLKENGVAKKIWIPRGLTISLCQDGRILRVRIRRPKMDLKSDTDPRYYLLRGSDTRAMVLSTDNPMSVIVESELDALLLHQEAGDLVNVVCLGNAQTRPDKEAADLLRQSRLILLSLDGDAAGGKESWQWWREHYPQARRWAPAAGKDPGDMWARGLNIRRWVGLGLMEYKEVAGQPERLLHLASAEEEPVIDEHHETASSSTPVTFPTVLATTPLDPLDSTFTCFTCSHFRPAVSPNPTQAFGRCEKRKRGRYGCATTCTLFE